MPSAPGRIASRKSRRAESRSTLDEVSPRHPDGGPGGPAQDERGAAAFFASMEELTQHSQQVADAVRRASNMRVQAGWAPIIDAITGIADRAELLAVNAELESERRRPGGARLRAAGRRRCGGWRSR